MKKELKIETVPVTIKIITVDGKKMTKSVLEQIQNDVFFNPQKISGYILGYVIQRMAFRDSYPEECRILLWANDEGELRKCNITQHFEVFSLYNIDTIYNISDDLFKRVFGGERSKYSIEVINDFFKYFFIKMSEIDSSQIYISI